MRHSEREKNVLVDELTAQNARLTSQLEAANQLEIQLNSKLQEVKNQYTIQHTTLQVIYLHRKTLYRRLHSLASIGLSLTFAF